MRVKIGSNCTDEDVGSLQFGKRYMLIHAGTSLVDEFTFTKKRNIKLVKFDYVGYRKLSHMWASKSKLKNILKSDSIAFMDEMKE